MFSGFFKPQELPQLRPMTEARFAIAFILSVSLKGKPGFLREALLFLTDQC